MDNIKKIIVISIWSLNLYSIFGEKKTCVPSAYKLKAVEVYLIGESADLKEVHTSEVEVL